MKTKQVRQFTYEDVRTALNAVLRLSDEEFVPIKGLKVCQDAGYIVEESEVNAEKDDQPIQ